MRRLRPSPRIALLVPTVVLATALLGPAAVPLVVCLGFLVAGLYPGEETLDRLRAARIAPAPPRPSDDGAPRLPRLVVARPGLALGGDIVRRGPPVLVA